MTALPKLTTLELDILAGVYASNYADTANPNIWSWSVEPRICEMQQRKGVVSSLNKKGILVSEGSGDDAAMRVTDVGAEIARQYGFYADGEGYQKEAHITFVEASLNPIKVVKPRTDSFSTLAADAKSVNDKLEKLINHTAKGGPVILSAKEAHKLIEILGTAKGLRFEEGVSILRNKGGK